MRRAAFLTFLILLCTVATLPAAEYGVYVQAVENAEGDFEGVVQKIGKALDEKGWQVIASHEAAVPEGCEFRALTMVLHNAAYARQVLAGGPRAAFAIPPRVGVFEDEKGIQVAYVNPASINRTVLGDGFAEKTAVEAAAELSAILTTAAGGSPVNRQIGQLRDKGRVGGMGGGDFEDKVEILHQEPASPTALADVAAKVKAGIKGNAKGWQLIYHLDYIPEGAIVFGVSKKSTEAKAYEIAGEKRRSGANSCPGIDHAASFPIEIVILQEGENVKVAILDEMYRMKVYFEDAGKWAFMKNMRMPGQIEDEVRQISMSQLQ